MNLIGNLPTSLIDKNRPGNFHNNDTEMHFKHLKLFTSIHLANGVSVDVRLPADKSRRLQVNDFRFYATTLEF